MALTADEKAAVDAKIAEVEAALAQFKGMVDGGATVLVVANAARVAHMALDLAVLSVGDATTP